MAYDIEPKTGNIFSDAVDWTGEALHTVTKPFGHAITDAWDTVVDGIKAIPGGDWVVDAVNNGADWLKGFAQTPIGFTVLSVVTYGMAAGTQIIVGPAVASQLAFLASAAPGMIKGESFATAFFTEWMDRAKRVAQYFGGQAADSVMQTVNTQVNDVFDKLITQLASQGIDVKQGLNSQLAQVAAQTLKKTGLTDQAKAYLQSLKLTPASLAKQYGIREDAAAIILGYLNGTVPDLDKYDLQTGKEMGLGVVQLPPDKNSGVPAQSLLSLKSSQIKPLLDQAIAEGRPQSVIQVLQNAYNQAGFNEYTMLHSTLVSVKKPALASSAVLAVDVQSSFVSSQPTSGPMKSLSNQNVMNALIANAPEVTYAAPAPPPDTLDVSPSESPIAGLDTRLLALLGVVGGGLGLWLYFRKRH